LQTSVGKEANTWASNLEEFEGAPQNLAEPEQVEGKDERWDYHDQHPVMEPQNCKFTVAKYRNSSNLRHMPLECPPPPFRIPPIRQNITACPTRKAVKAAPAGLGARTSGRRRPQTAGSDPQTKPQTA
jgi:hypothetical protein